MNFKKVLSINDVAPDKTLSEKGESGRLFIWKRFVELIAMNPSFRHGIDNLAIPFSVFYKEDIVKYWGSLEPVLIKHIMNIYK
jgi:hypothetical protein